MMAPYTDILAVLVIILSVVLIQKKVDVRLVLIASALLIASSVGKFFTVFESLSKSMAESAVIGPICSAMGFAFVLKELGCDKEMVRLLFKPIRNFTWMLIPGGCAIGFFTNMAITSQTAAAAAVGPILIPLMLRAGYHPVVAAATLVLGCSGGGNLFNPGEPDIVNIVKYSGASTGQVLSSVVIPHLMAFTSAAALFTFIAYKFYPVKNEVASESTTEKINYLYALLPPLPVIILLVSLGHFAPLQFLNIWFPKGIPVAYAMFFSTIVAILLSRANSSELVKQFFNGLGYGYVHVISLIIAATCFIDSLKLIKFIDHLVSVVSSTGIFGSVASVFSTLGLAVVSGSGTAPSVGFSQAVLPSLSLVDIQSSVNAGVLGAIGATFGRTMSPVAAIVLYATTLVDTSANSIVKLLAVPLLVGAVIAIAAIHLFG